MSYKKILISCLLLCGTLLFLGFRLVYYPDLNVCIPNNFVACNYYYSFNLGHPLVLGLTPLIPLLVLLYFCRREVVMLWFKIASVCIPICILIIANTPVYCNAPLGLCFDKKGMTKTLSIAFVLLSLCVVAIASYRARKSGGERV